MWFFMPAGHAPHGTHPLLYLPPCHALSRLTAWVQGIAASLVTLGAPQLLLSICGPHPPRAADSQLQATCAHYMVALATAGAGQGRSGGHGTQHPGSRGDEDSIAPDHAAALGGLQHVSSGHGWETWSHRDHHRQSLQG